MAKDFKFFRDDKPSDRPAVTPILKIKGSDQFTFVVISPTVYGYGTHWCDKLTKPCDGPPETCSLHKKELPYKWLGYFLVAVGNHKEHQFLELTKTAYDRFRECTAEFEVKTGLHMHVMRERKTDKSPLKFVLLDCNFIGRVKSPDKSPDATLRRVWRFEN